MASRLQRWVFGWPHLVKFKGAAGNVAVPARGATFAQGNADRRTGGEAPRRCGGHKDWDGEGERVSLSGQNNASVIGANPDSTSCFIRLWWPDSDNYFDSLCSSKTNFVNRCVVRSLLQHSW